MSASTPSKSTLFNVRSRSYWLICLFIIYSIFGWFIVPKLVESQLTEQLKTLANWETKVGSIVFNPYTLSLKITNADIQDQSAQGIIRFDELFINFSLLETLSGTISFDEISLRQPFVYLHIDENGVTNFQHAFASDTKEPEALAEENSDDMLGLFFDLIAISSGKIHLSDDSQGQNFQLDIEPLTLALEGFSTDNNDGGDYALSISLGNDQEINWKGQIGIAPFTSSGQLALTNIDSNSIWHYAKSASPLWLKQARMSITGNYQTSVSADTTELKIDNTTLSIQDAIVTETPSTEPMLEFAALTVSPISFDLSKRSLDLGNIALNQAGISIQRSADASLNILRPFNTNTTAQPKDAQTPAVEQTLNTAQTSKTEPQPFHWNITSISIDDGKITWQDNALATPANLGIGAIDLTIGAMSHDLSQAFPYDLSFMLMPAHQGKALPSTTQQILKGALSPAPFSLKGLAELKQIDLSAFQPYLSETANIAIENGVFSLNTEYDLAMLPSTNNGAITGNIISTVSITDLALTDTFLNKPLSGFKSLSVGPVSFDLADSDQLTIDSIVLDQPYGDIFVSEYGHMNLSHLSKRANQKAIEKIDEEINKKPSKEPNKEPNSHNEKNEKTLAQTLAFLLKRFELNQGQVRYSDASLTPIFSTKLSDLSGSIENISSDDDANSSLDIKGKIDEHGHLSVKGTVNPLSKTPNTKITVLANNIDMTMASPYSAKYAGYQIEKGKLNLDLSYDIKDTKLDANNEVLLKQFEFGQSVDSDDATTLPLPLAIGILKNRQGEIDIDLPISGDLSDPSFKISSVLLNTFVNLVTKVVTSPFSILGGLIEGGDELSHIEFSANNIALAEPQLQKIFALAKALKDRPKLTLEIRGIADAQIDKTPSAVRSDAELLQLAKARAQTMYQAVIEAGAIDKARVFILEPEIITSDQPEAAAISNETENASSAPQVSSKFTLGVR